MNKIKKRLSAYRKTLNFSGIERELGLPKFTLKMWLYQDTTPTQDVQNALASFLNKLGQNIL